MGEISDALKRAKARIPTRSPAHDPERRTGAADTPTAEVDASDTVVHSSDSPAEADTAPSRPAASGPPDPDSTTAVGGEGTPPTNHKTPYTFSSERTGDWVSRIVAVAPESQIAVRFRHLAIRTRTDLADRSRSSILVTSSVPGEGKTTVSINLALALASIAPESTVGLVDMDLRRARLGAALECEINVGFEEALAGRAAIDAVRVSTNIENLDVYAVRHSNRSPHQTLGSATAASVIDELHARYDYLIFDGPPVLPVPDVPLIESRVGGCLLIIRSRVTRHAALNEMMELLPRKSIVGAFLNDAAMPAGRNAYGDYGYYGRDQESDQA